ncbi:hypothetical protein LIER_08883 [Lithospermum erythrorhizon]|uniref:Uncharacterized protein n=1 Tax=Lithospermum erythrorhizon TaxID=34254 RepID=A0AAV3PGI2_LITER
MDDLQSWSNIELKRRNVRDVDEAIAVAKDLIELKKEFPKKEKRRGDSSLLKTVEKLDNSPTGALTSSWRGRTIERDKKGHGHSAMGIKRMRVVIMIVGDKNDENQSVICVMEHIGLRSIHKRRRPKSGGLVYVEAKVNGGTTTALVDTSATHNFISLEEARRLRIRYTKETGWIKVVNSAAQPIFGVARGIPIHLGQWSRTIDVMIAPMDDCHMVLGVEFFHQVSSVTFEKNNTMHLHEGATTYKVPLRRDQTGIRRI